MTWGKPLSAEKLESDVGAAGLIDQIYACIRAPERWNDLFANIGAWLAADAGVMMTPALPGATPVMLFAYGLVVTSIMPAYLKYAGRAEFSNRALATGRVPGAFLFDELMPPEEQARSDYWREVVAPLGFTSGLFGMVRTPDEGTPVILNYYRKAPQAAFTEDDVARFETLFPHLRRALSICLDGPPAKALPSVARDLYQTIGTACFLLDGEGGVAHQNQAATELMAARKAVRVCGARLLLADADAQAQLEAAVRRIIIEPWSARYRVGAEILARSSSHGGAFIVIVSPVGAETPLTAVSSPLRCAVLILEERLRTTDALRERLRRLYGMTDAEIDVAIDLASGHSAQEISLRRGSALATVRVQVKRALAKTNTHRQADLVSLIGRLRV